MFDFIILGGGILGVSTAWQLQHHFPDKSIALLEKETQLAQHQTGRNSGVLHAGVYYRPDSLKARFCLAGNQATKSFCTQHNVKIEHCGKLLVATNELELQRMAALQDRAAANGLVVELLSKGQLRELEPNITGLSALLVKDTSIVDFYGVVKKMAELFQANGGKIFLNTFVTAMEETATEIIIKSLQQSFNGRYLISCTGLFSDRTVRMLGLKPDFRIVPFRGDYFRLKPKHNNIIHHLIYPIPDPALPFLGVHLTKMIDGFVTIGPNAVLACKREGYRRWDFSLRDCMESLSYSGFYKVLFKHLKSTLGEFRDVLSTRHYLARIQKYCPTLMLADLLHHPAGVRAQAIRQDGRLIDDFLFMSTRRSVHVCNAPSPAATSAIPIASHIIKQVIKLRGD